MNWNIYYTAVLDHLLEIYCGYEKSVLKNKRKREKVHLLGQLKPNITATELAELVIRYKEEYQMTVEARKKI